MYTACDDDGLQMTKYRCFRTTLIPRVFHTLHAKVKIEPKLATGWITNQSQSHFWQLQDVSLYFYESRRALRPTRSPSQSDWRPTSRGPNSYDVKLTTSSLNVVLTFERVEIYLHSSSMPTLCSEGQLRLYCTIK
jgi:hypothetical protein